ncbi:MAG: pyrophosphatase PpaX [Candidatus Microgenomates bacterium]
MIKTVLFDVDGVLLDSFEANLVFYQNLFNKFGYIGPTKEEYKKMHHLTMIDVIRKITKIDNEDKIKKIWQVGKSREVRYPDELLKTPKNLKKILFQLSKKYQLGIVTSRVRGGLFKISVLKEFENNFKVVVYFDDTKNHKPNPEPILFALRKLKLKPSEVVYIGDAESDIIASKAAGVKIIFYSKEKNNEADFWTDSFDKIPTILKKL